MSTGAWLARPALIAFGYQWQVDGADLAGATAAAYVPEVAAEGRALRCIVTASNAAGSSAWTTEPKTVAAAAATAPTITGTPTIVGGGVIGVAQTVGGFTVAYIGVPSFIVTLGGLLIWRGLIFRYAQGQTIAPMDSTFRLLGGGPQGSLGDTWSWVLGGLICIGIAYSLFTARRKRQ